MTRIASRPILLIPEDKIRSRSFHGDPGPRLAGRTDGRRPLHNQPAYAILWNVLKTRNFSLVMMKMKKKLLLRRHLPRNAQIFGPDLVLRDDSRIGQEFQFILYLLDHGTHRSRRIGLEAPLLKKAPRPTQALPSSSILIVFFSHQYSTKYTIGDRKSVV